VVDGAVLLIQHRRNPQSMVLRAQQIVDAIKTPLLGVVLNQVPNGGDYGYYWALNCRRNHSRAGDDYGYYTSNYRPFHRTARRLHHEGVEMSGGKPRARQGALVLEQHVTGEEDLPMAVAELDSGCARHVAGRVEDNLNFIRAPRKRRA
jgi:hypothetical protein